MKFLQQFWPLLKEDLVNIFNELHHSGTLVKSLKSTLFVLIAKVEGVKDIKQFRPINLVGCIFKLISKVLARKLTKVLGDLIGDCQHAFVEGRQILDAVLV